MKNFACIGACLLALCWLPHTCAAAAPQYDYTLDNGMRVIVKPDHRAPVVVSMIWYRVGSMDEWTGYTGLAHVLEHMMFKGTSDVPAGEFSRRVAAAGGKDNASTGLDATVYYQMLQKSQLPLALRLEADRMANLTLSAADFAREIRVVMEERRWRIEDRARALLYEQLMATAFKASPARRPVIGWMNDLENLSIEDVRAFYRRWYVPNNALLVLVGDVEPQEALALARQYFGPLKPRPLPVRKPQREPAQRGLQRVTVKAPAKLPYVAMAYHAPALRDAKRDTEPYAMEMLTYVLDGNDAARLNRDLVRQERVASAVNASYDSFSRGPVLFRVGGTPAAGKSVEDLERALRNELKRIVDEGVSADELERVRAQIVAAHVFARDSMFFQAQQIGTLEMAGLSHGDIDLMIGKLKAVTAAEVQAVARKYLVDDGLTVAYLDPQPLRARRPQARPQGGNHAR